MPGRFAASSTAAASLASESDLAGVATVLMVQSQNGQDPSLTREEYEARLSKLRLLMEDIQASAPYRQEVSPGQGELSFASDTSEMTAQALPQGDRKSHTPEVKATTLAYIT